LNRAIRRLLASVMLVTVVASFAAPPHVGSCPEPGTPFAGRTLVAAMDMDHGACAHPGAGPCLTASGCVSAPSALRSASAAVASRLTAVLVRPVAVPHYADLFRTGPPTPPPNSI